MLIKNFTITFIYIIWGFLLFCMIEKILIHNYFKKNPQKIKQRISDFFKFNIELSKVHKMEIIEYMKNDLLFDYGCQVYIKESEHYTENQILEMKKFLNVIYNNKVKTSGGIFLCLKYRNIFKEFEKTEYRNSVLTRYWKEKTNN